MRGSDSPGFPVREFHQRLRRAQDLMQQDGIAALLLTTEPEIRYFTGFLTRFWESPTRPWFVIVPVRGDPVAVIPAIGVPLMARGWISDIRSWDAPDYVDDGIGLLRAALCDLTADGARIGVPGGMESHVRMPLTSWRCLSERIGARSLGADGGIMRRLRLVKSPLEIAKIEAACRVADRAFARVPEIAGAGVALDQVFRGFQILCLDEGADWISYLAGGAGPGGYGDVISPATPRPLKTGDVLMLDTGVVRDGYFCDFDRNWSVGPPTPEIEDAFARLTAASAAGLAAARPGAEAADLYHAMADVLGPGCGGGRLGHGLGMQLTEWPSLIPADHTRLEPGMVLTLEPGYQLAAGRMLVHEENIVVTEAGARYLSTPAPPTIGRLEA